MAVSHHRHIAISRSTFGTFQSRRREIAPLFFEPFSATNICTPPPYDSRPEMAHRLQTRQCADSQPLKLCHFVMNNIRFALRQLRKTPAVTVVSILTLALAIGANTSIFSVVRAVLLRPLPYPDPDRLVILAESEPE